MIFLVQFPIQIGWHEVLLPINHNYNKSCDILGFFKLNQKKFWQFFRQQWKKSQLSVHVWCRVLSNYSVLLVLKSGPLIPN